MNIIHHTAPKKYKNFLLGVSRTSGYTAELGEKDKHAKNDIPCTEREVGYVSHWSWRYLVAGEMRPHKKLSQGLPRN